MHNDLPLQDLEQPLSSRKITDPSMVMSAEQIERLRSTTYGGPSKILNEAFDSFAKINGGRLPSCVHGEYQKDFVTDLKLKDTFRQDRESFRSTFNFRRDNVAQVLRENDTKRKLRMLRNATLKTYATTPIVKHKPGFVPSFYPTRMAHQQPETTTLDE